jgi:hypothetical protein
MIGILSRHLVNQSQSLGIFGNENQKYLAPSEDVLRLDLGLDALAILGDPIRRAFLPPPFVDAVASRISDLPMGTRPLHQIFEEAVAPIKLEPVSFHTQNAPEIRARAREFKITEKWDCGYKRIATSVAGDRASPPPARAPLLSHPVHAESHQIERLFSPDEEPFSTAALRPLRPPVSAIRPDIIGRDGFRGRGIRAEIQRRSIRAGIGGRSRAKRGKRWASMKAERRAKVDSGGNILSVAAARRR